MDHAVLCRFALCRRCTDTDTFYQLEDREDALAQLKEVNSSQAEAEQRLQESLRQAKQECDDLQNNLTALQNASARQYKEASMQADALQRELRAANVCIIWNECGSIPYGWLLCSAWNIPRKGNAERDVWS